MLRVVRQPSLVPYQRVQRAARRNVAERTISAGGNFAATVGVAWHVIGELTFQPTLISADVSLTMAATGSINGTVTSTSIVGSAAMVMGGNGQVSTIFLRRYNTRPVSAGSGRGAPASVGAI